MKNLEKELQKISKLPIGFDQDKGDYGKFYFNDLYELFSKTLDDVIEQAKPIYIDRGNTVGDRKAGREEATKEYEQNLRARKKELFK